MCAGSSEPMRFAPKSRVIIYLIFSYPGQQHEADFVKKSPFHKIPLIDDDGFLLAERFVHVKGPGPGITMPP